MEHVVRMGSKWNINGFGGNIWSRRPLGRPYRCWWKEYMKMEHRETGWDRWIVWCTWERKEITMFMVGTPKGKKLLWRPKCWWKFNTTVEHSEAGWKGVNWINLGQDRDQWCGVLNMVMKLWVSSNVGNFVSSWETINFSRRPLLHYVGWLPS